MGFYDTCESCKHVGKNGFEDPCNLCISSAGFPYYEKAPADLAKPEEAKASGAGQPLLSGVP